MIQYILDVSLTWVFLYLIFYVFLRKETFFNVNRYYLISAISTGILLPFLRHLHFDLQATDLPEVAPLVMFIQESPAVIILLSDRPAGSGRGQCSHMPHRPGCRRFSPAGC